MKLLSVLRTNVAMMPLRSSLCAAILSLTVVGAGGVGCLKSACPFVETSTVTIDPEAACLQAHVETCLRATLVVRNNCSEILNLPVEYAVFDNDAYADPTVEVVPGAGVAYEVRQSVAIERTSKRESYEIPATLGATPITFRFSIQGE